MHLRCTLSLLYPTVINFQNVPIKAHQQASQNFFSIDSWKGPGPHSTHCPVAPTRHRTACDTQRRPPARQADTILALMADERWKNLETGIQM